MSSPAFLALQKMAKSRTAKGIRAKVQGNLVASARHFERASALQDCCDALAESEIARRNRERYFAQCRESWTTKRTTN